VDPTDAFFDELYESSTEPFLTPALAAGELRAFTRLTSPEPGARVLDLGCGWGRHLQPLRDAGFRPFGLERSSRYARRAAASGPVVRSDVRALPFRSGAFDAVACFYASIFFFDDTGNLDAFREAARVTKPGGRFVLHGSNPLHLKRLGEQARTLELPGGASVFESSVFDPATLRENLFRRLTRADGTQLEGRISLRTYGPGELEVMGHRAGFKLERLCGSLRLEPWSRGSRDVVVCFVRSEAR